MEYKTSLVQRNKQLEQTNKNLWEVLGVAADLIQSFARYAKECTAYHVRVLDMCDTVDEYVANTDKTLEIYSDTLHIVKFLLNVGDVNEAIEVINDTLASVNTSETQDPQAPTQ